MKQGGDSRVARGFTIVEVLIVLAVTSALLTVAIVFMGGKQAKTEFAIGSRQIRQDIEQVINEAASGYYPNSENFTCSRQGDYRQVQIAAGSESQGASNECIYVGNAMLFGQTRHVQDMRVVPLAGNKETTTATGKSDVTDIRQAHPTAIAPGVLGGPNDTAPDQSRTVRLPVGFEYAGYWLDTAGSLSVPPGDFAVAVLSDFASAGTQHFSVYSIQPWAPGNSDRLEVMELNQSVASTAPPSFSKYSTYSAIHLCFKHDTAEKSAEISMGREGGIGVEMKVYTGAKCGQS